MQHIHIDAEMEFEEVKEFTMSLVYDGFEQISVSRHGNKWIIKGSKPLREIHLSGVPE